MNPCPTRPRLHTQEIHGVDFFETAALAFDHEEIYNEYRQETTTAKDIAVRKPNSCCNERGKEGVMNRSTRVQSKVRSWLS